jgi:hypothetical protein
LAVSRHGVFDEFRIGECQLCHDLLEFLELRLPIFMVVWEVDQRVVEIKDRA